MARNPGSYRDKPFDITARSFAFARDVICAYPQTAHSHGPSAQVWRQLVAAASSVGANTEEAQAASSRADFRFRMKIALREAREANYWLRLIEAAHLRGHEHARPMQMESSELVAILTVIVKKISD